MFLVCLQARHALYCIMASMDKKDSIALLSGSCMCKVGLLVILHHALFFFPSSGPRCSTSRPVCSRERDSCSRRTGKLDYLGDDFTLFPSAAQCLDFSVTCYASAYGVLVIFYVPLSDSHLLGVRQWSTRLWIFLGDAILVYFRIQLLLVQHRIHVYVSIWRFMVQTANCGVSTVAVLFLVVDIPFVTQRLIFWVCSADLEFPQLPFIDKFSMSLLCRSTCRPYRDAEADPHGPSLQKSIVIPHAVH